MSESTGPEPGPHVCHGARSPGGSQYRHRSTQSFLLVWVQGDSVPRLGRTHITSMISSSIRRSEAIPFPSDADQSEVHNWGHVSYQGACKEWGMLQMQYIGLLNTDKN